MYFGSKHGWGNLMSKSRPEESTDADTMQHLLAGLSSEYRRQVVACFVETETSIASVADLAEYVHAEGDDTSASLDRIKIRLHHVALPKLAATGVLDYDPRTRTVRYHGEPTLENIQEYLSVDGD